MLNHNNNQYQNTWYTDDYHVEPIPEYRQAPKCERKRHTLGKRGMAGILVATMLFSAGLGFGGGWLATSLNSKNQTTTVPNTETSSITAQQLAAGDQSSFNAAAVAAVGLDSVVEITTESLSRANRIMGQYVTTGAGSGVIISEDGYIVTNNHVVSGASKITVRTRDTTEYSASIVGTDEKTDLAVIKIEAKGLKAAEYGVSKDLVVGQPVLAIGNPLGELGGTVTDGIISALDREVEIEGQKMTLLQTDASVNPGNSGGGLFDGSGKLIGIVNAKSSGSGIEGLGFAIPIDTARNVIDEMMKNGYVTGRVSVGIEMTVIDEQKAYLYRLDRAGVYISAVSRGSAAEAAGIQAGDRIVAIDGKEIDSTETAVEIVQSHKVGDQVEFKISRDGKEQKIVVTLGEEKPTASSIF